MDTDTIKSPQKVKDISKLFGGKAKFKKVKTKKRVSLKQDDASKINVNLKYVDDSKKNLYRNTLPSDNTFDYKLRKSPQPNLGQSNTDNCNPPFFNLRHVENETLSPIDQQSDHSDDDENIISNFNNAEDPILTQKASSLSTDNAETEIASISTTSSSSSSSRSSSISEETTEQPQTVKITIEEIQIETDQNDDNEKPPPNNGDPVLNDNNLCISPSDSEFYASSMSSIDEDTECDTEDEDDRKYSLKNRISKRFLSKTNISLDTKSKPAKIKKERTKRAQSAISHKEMDYFDIFGDDDDKPIVFGAIKTPKFAKKKKKKIEKPKSATHYSSEIENLFDLSDIFGDDDDGNDTNIDKIDEGDEYFSDYMSSSESSSSAPSPSPSPQPSPSPVPSSSSSSSPSIDLPMPSPSNFEIEQDKVKLEKAEFKRLSAQIDEDLLNENAHKYEMEQLQKKRATEIMQDMNDLFDLSDEEQSFESFKDDELVQSDEQKQESEEIIMQNDEQKTEKINAQNDEQKSEKIIVEKMKNAKKRRRSITKTEKVKIEIQKEDKKEQKVLKGDITLWRLMIDFKLKPHKKPKDKKLYEYFHQTLGIEMASDLLNFDSTQITQPPNFKSTKMRMHLVKMAQFITKKAQFDGWTGTKTQNWIELESNRLSVTFGHTEAIMKQINMSSTSKKPSVCYENDNNADDEKQTNAVNIIGHKTVFIDKKIKIAQDFNAIFIIDSLPEIKSNSHCAHLISIGVQWFDANNKLLQKVYISDRCLIYQNDSYSKYLSCKNSKFIENGCEISVNLQNKQKNPKVTFALMRNGKMIKDNEQSIVIKDFVQESFGWYAKMFIEQYYGNGIYFVEEKECEKEKKYKANIQKFRRSMSKKQVVKRAKRHSL